MKIYNGMKSPPCKDCTERHIGCHGHCEAYKAFHDHHTAEKAARQLQNEMTDYFVKSALKQRRKNRRK